MPDLNSSNNPITSDGQYTIKVTPGKKYVLGVACNTSWSTTTVDLYWVRNNGEAALTPLQQFTADGLVAIKSPSNRLLLDVANVSGRQIEIYIAAEK